MRALLFLAALAVATTTAVQDVDVTARLDDAERLLRARDFPAAVGGFEQSLEIARARGDEPAQARALAGLSDAALQRAIYPDARERALQALAIYERLEDLAGIGRVNYQLAIAGELTGALDDAMLRARRAIDAYDRIGDRRGRAAATLQLLRVLKSDDVSYRPLIERVLEDARASGDLGLEGRAAHQLGDRLFSLGDYEPAFSMLERAAALYQQTGNDVALGAVYNSIGRVYRAHGHLEAALEYQLKALELHQRGDQPFNTAQSLNAVSAVYEMLGDNQKSIEYLERAVSLADQFGSPRISDFLRGNLAGLLIKEGEFDRGARLLAGVLERGVDTYTSMRWSRLGYALRKLGRLDEALHAAETAVAQCSPMADTECAEALSGRAEVHVAKGDRALALADLEQAIAGFEASRARLIGSDFFKREFAHRREAIYSLAIRLQLQEGQTRDGLETAELARSRAFVDLLATRDVRLKAKDQSTIAALREAEVARAPERPAANSLADLAMTMRGSSSSGAASDVAPRELRSFVSATPATAADFAAAARRLHSTLVAYWVARDELFIWVVAANGDVKTARLDLLDSKLRRLIRAAASSGSPAGELPSARARAWRELYDVLIRPVRGALPKTSGALLTIVPHGPLVGLPFAALLDERGRYLLETYTLHYVPAGAVLQFTAAKRHADPRTGRVLVVADPPPLKSSRLDQALPPLPGARLEAQAIAKLVPRSRLTVLTGAAATETRVLSAVGHKAVIHLATHAILRDDDPFASFLAFGADAPANDGLLTAQEVYGLDLDADLIVLSACRSAGGRIGGDGVAAFARAFIYAGTPTLVASMWDVPDATTGALTSAFYRNWLGGMAKARALRAAQLQVLRSLRAGRLTVDTAAGPVVVPEHPIFWAGFALIGEPD